MKSHFFSWALGIYWIDKRWVWCTTQIRDKHIFSPHTHTHTYQFHTQQKVHLNYTTFKSHSTKHTIVQISQYSHLINIQTKQRFKYFQYTLHRQTVAYIKLINHPCKNFLVSVDRFSSSWVWVCHILTCWRTRAGRGSPGKAVSWPQTHTSPTHVVRTSCQIPWCWQYHLPLEN